MQKLASMIISILIMTHLTGCHFDQDRQLNIYNPDRITKKSFGTYVEPGNSPVDPEVFRGFHTALDFEAFEDEEGVAVPVFAICNGPLVVNRWAQGYGGVVVQSCNINAKNVTVIYGHIDLSSVPNKRIFKFGDVIGVLGDAYSYETDNERKHLHLGIHKGSDVNLLGYVQTRDELEGWMNPFDILSLELE